MRGADVDVRAGELPRRLRAAGCVFAEEEAAALQQAARDAADLEVLLRRREAGEPLEQLVGWVGFAGARLAVGPGVFVPRQRSVLLARLAEAAVRAQPAPVLVEACAGVAPIASTVARAVPAVRVHVTDVDPRALRYARRNLPPGAGVHRGNLLRALPPALRARVTVLAAVPPYVPDGATHLLPHEAREHEPATALRGGADGLDLVRALVEAAGPWLAPRARVLVELHRGQVRDAARHAARAGFRARRHDGEDGQTSVLDLTAAGAGGGSGTRR